MMTMITWMSLTSPERVNDPYLGVSEKSGKGINDPYLGASEKSGKGY